MMYNFAKKKKYNKVNIGTMLSLSVLLFLFMLMLGLTFTSGGGEAVIMAIITILTIMAAVIVPVYTLNNEKKKLKNAASYFSSCKEAELRAKNEKESGEKKYAGWRQNFDSKLSGLKDKLSGAEPEQFTAVFKEFVFD